MVAQYLVARILTVFNSNVSRFKVGELKLSVQSYDGSIMVLSCEKCI